MKPTVLILPGYGNSGETHWQSLWEKKHTHFKRVEQKDWMNPICDEWVASLEKALNEADSEVFLVAHSMACLVVAHWASQKHHSIKGALLVGVPDVNVPAFPKSALGFENTPSTPFDFPSIVVASSDDIYASVDYAQDRAKAWGSEFVTIGKKGHINAESNLGFWDEGCQLFERLQKGI